MAQAYNEMLVRACIMHELESYLQNFIGEDDNKDKDLYIQFHAQEQDWYTLRIYEKDLGTYTDKCLGKIGFAPSGRIPISILEDEEEELPF